VEAGEAGHLRGRASCTNPLLVIATCITTAAGARRRENANETNALLGRFSIPAEAELEAPGVREAMLASAFFLSNSEREGSTSGFRSAANRGSSWRMRAPTHLGSEHVYRKRGFRSRNVLDNQSSVARIGDRSPLCRLRFASKILPSASARRLMQETSASNSQPFVMSRVIVRPSLSPATRIIREQAALAAPAVASFNSVFTSWFIC